MTIRDKLRQLWNPYPRLEWPFLWKLMAVVVRHYPGRQCAWHMNREFAKYPAQDIGLIWAEGYWIFFVLISVVWNNPDGSQGGSAHIMPWVHGEERSFAAARDLLMHWDEIAKKAKKEWFEAKGAAAE